MRHRHVPKVPLAPALRRPSGRARTLRERDAEAQKLKRRFSRLSRQLERREGLRALPRKLRAWTAPVLVSICLGVALAIPFATSPWSMTVTARHWLAAPNCNAARWVMLAPAYRGQPGYYSRHDADNDGIACEPWPPRR